MITSDRLNAWDRVWTQLAKKRFHKETIELLRCFYLSQGSRDELTELARTDPTLHGVRLAFAVALSKQLQDEIFQASNMFIFGPNDIDQRIFTPRVLLDIIAEAHAHVGDLALAKIKPDMPKEQQEKLKQESLYRNVQGFIMLFLSYLAHDQAPTTI